MPLISRALQGISAGIGVASEAIADHKEKKANREAGLSPQTSSTSNRARSVSPDPARGSEKHDNDNSGDSESDLDADQTEWALDDAAEDLDPPAYSESDVLSDVPPMPVEEVVRSFIRSHDTGLSTKVRPIPMPVILPQRRPKDKSRGFVRAYPPMLGEYSDIDEKTFLDFLNNFDKASKASPIFDVINLACFAIGFIPNPIAMGVTIAVQTASRTAQELQGRVRTNNYLDQMNEYIFKPRGLYAMIMTFKPNSEDVVIGVDLTSTDVALSKSLSTPDSELRKKLKQIRLTSGVTKGEMSLPEGAPLIYPAIDAAAIAAVEGDAPSAKKQNSLKESGAAIASYLDRRAQAKYGDMHPESKLAASAPPAQKQFASRFSDPNHQVNSGTILGLLTGGTFDPKAKSRRRKALRKAHRRGYELSETELRNIEMGRAPKKGIISRVLQKDVLYMIITNLPSESELKEMSQELEKLKSQQGGFLSKFGSR